MSIRRQSKRALLSAHLERCRPERIGEAEWDDLLLRLAPISESYLRQVLRATGLPLAPLVEGVRQDSFENLERTLLALQTEYRAAMLSGDSRRARRCRRTVITAKDHARLVAAGPKTAPEKKSEKEEMILWLLTWLENPSIFPAWVTLRKAELTRQTAKFRKPA